MDSKKFKWQVSVIRQLLSTVVVFENWRDRGPCRQNITFASIKEHGPIYKQACNPKLLKLVNFPLSCLDEFAEWHLHSLQHLTHMELRKRIIFLAT